MQKKWYTLFLLISLLGAYFYTGGRKLYELGMEAKNIPPGRVEMPWEEAETIPADPAMEKEVPEETGEDKKEETVNKVQENTTEKREENTGAKADEKSSDEEQSQEIASWFTDEFQNVLFIGDSRTVGLYEYGQMGEAKVFADNGMSVFNLWKNRLSFSGGEKQTLEQVLQEKQYPVIHFMLGINELGYSREQVVKKYRESVEKVQRLQPGAQIILGANLHVTAEKSAGDAIFNNENINGLNEEIKKIAEESGYCYLDVNVLFDDVGGNLAKVYSTDGVHVLGKYYADWTAWLKNGGKEQKNEEE